jgi:uncharacterized protein YdhG (YjbR/CyaY superfamily)
MSPKMMINVASIDEYLEALPEDVRWELQRLREIIHSVAPEVTERVSYGIPIFRLNRDWVGIGATKGHCSFYLMSPPLAKKMKDELKEFKVSGATIHFQPGKPLPEALVRKILAARLGELKGK